MAKKEIETRTIMFQQQIKYLKLTLDEIDAKLKQLHATHKGIRYAYITHDQDVDKNTNEKVEPHIHAMVQLGVGQRWTLSKWAEFFDEPVSTIQAWRGYYNTGVAYLVHLTDNAVIEGKFPYSPEDVVSNEDIPALLSRSKKLIDNSKKSTVNLALTKLDAGMATLDELADELIGKDKVDFLRKGSVIVNYQQSKIGEVQPMETYFIYGEPGIGKSRLAYELAGDDFFVTGSARDPFAGYKGESVVIWDDARFKSMDASEILRMLDPHAKKRTAGARFHDANLNNVKKFYITTVDNPFRLWDNAFGKDEPYAQFKRRLSDVYHVKKSNYEMENSRKNKKLPWLETKAKSNKIKSDDKQND